MEGPHPRHQAVFPRWLLWTLLLFNVGMLAGISIATALIRDCPSPCDWSSPFVALMLMVDWIAALSWMVVRLLRLVRRLVR